MAFTLTTAAEAGVVFNSGSPDYEDGHGSSFGLAQVAEDFSLSPNSGPLTGVIWWGSYTVTGAPPTTDDFTIRIFDDVNGMAATTPFISLDVGGVNRTATGQNVANRFPAYEYSATLPSLALAPNTQYWISIVDGTTAGSAKNFYWATSNWVSGDALIRSVDNMAWRSVYTGRNGAEEAFELTAMPAAVPEPTTLLLSGVGFLALVCQRAIGASRRFRRSGAA